MAPHDSPSHALQNMTRDAVEILKPLHLSQYRVATDLAPAPYCSLMNASALFGFIGITSWFWRES